MANEFIARKGFISLDSAQVTGSLSVTGNISASIFSGSFVGNGSQLTGVSAGFPFTGSAGITGSLTVVGPVNATTFTGDGSQLTGIEGFPFTGSARITGSLVVVGPVNATSFTGSIQGTATSASYVQLTNVDGFTAYSASINTTITPQTATVNTGSSPLTLTTQSIVVADSTNGNLIINLPDLNTVIGTPNQKPIVVYKNDYSQNVIYVNPSGSQLVNGASQDIIVSIQLAVIYNPTSAGWVTEGTSAQSLAELELFFVPRTETGSFATTGSNTFNGNQIVTGSLNVSGSTNITQYLTVEGNIINSSTATALALDGENVTVIGDLLVGGNDIKSNIGTTAIRLSGSSVSMPGPVTITGSLNISGSVSITGSLTVTGGITGSATSASYVEYTNVANKPTLVSGSSQITYSGLTGVPSGIVSGSSQVTYSGLTGVPSGIVSSSAQVGGYGVFATTGSNQFNGSQAVTGSLTVTGQVVAQTLNVQQVTSSIVYSSGSNVFGNSLGNTQQFTGSVSVTGSLTVAGAGTFASSVTANGDIYYYNAGNLNAIITSGAAANGRMYLYASATADIGLQAGGNSWFLNNLGIGTNNPTPISTYTTLEIRGATGGGIKIGKTAFAQFNIQHDGTDAYFNNTANGSLYVYTNDTERMRISSTGATTFKSGTETTSVSMLSTGTASGLRLQNTGGTAADWIIQSDGGVAATAALRFYSLTASAYRMSIDGSGNVGIGITNPTERLHLVNTTTGYVGLRLEGSGTYAGTDWTIYASSSSPSSADDFLGFYNNSTADGATAEYKLRIFKNGNVGIGTASPSYPLSIYKNNNGEAVLQIYNPNSGSGAYSAIYLGNDSLPNSGGIAVFSSTFTASGMIQPNSLYVSANRNGGISINSEEATAPIRFGTANTERMRITSGGLVLIGGTSTTGAYSLSLGNSTANTYYQVRSTNTDSLYGADTRGTWMGNLSGMQAYINCPSFVPGVDNSTSLGSSSYRWTAVYAVNGSIQTSDERQKTNIQTSDLGLDFISKLNPVSYKWIIGRNDTEYNSVEDETGRLNPLVASTPVTGVRTHYGLIAQHVKEILGDKDFGGFVHDQETDVMSLRYDQFIAPMIKSIQEQQSQIESLKAEIQTLKQ